MNKINKVEFEFKLAQIMKEYSLSIEKFRQYINIYKTNQYIYIQPLMRNMKIDWIQADTIMKFLESYGLVKPIKMCKCEVCNYHFDVESNIKEINCPHCEDTIYMYSLAYKKVKCEEL